MAEETVEAYAVEPDNSAAAAGTKVSVVDDGTGKRQVVVLGKGDGSSDIYDGSDKVPVDTGLTIPTPQTDALTNAELRADAVPVSGPLTDEQLRATPVPVTGSVTAVVDESTLAKESGGNLDAIKADLDAIKTDTDKIPASPATAGNQTTANTSLGDIDTNLGAKADTAASSDTGTFSLIALFKRALQTFTSIKNDTDAIAGYTATNATAANQTNGSQQAQIVQGGNAAGVEAGDFNGLIAGNHNTKTIPFTTNGAIGAQVLLADTDVRKYASVSIVWTAVGSGLAATVQFAPNSGGTYIANTLFTNRNSLTSAPASSGVAVNTIYEAPIVNSYLKLNITALTSGTATGYIILSTRPLSYQAPAISIVESLGASTTGPQKLEDVASANGDALVGIAPIRRDTPVANVSADGDYTNMIVDNFGRAWTASEFIIGSTAPLNAALMGAINSAGNLASLNTAGASGDGASEKPLSTAIDLFNGSNWDRARSNEAVTLLASASRTTTQTSADLINYNGLSALDIILDATVIGTGSITISINGKDPASGKYYNILTGAAVVTNSTNRYRVNPHLAAVTNSIAQDILPRVFQIVVTANNANAVTYSVGYNLSRAT